MKHTNRKKIWVIPQEVLIEILLNKGWPIIYPIHPPVPTSAFFHGVWHDHLSGSFHAMFSDDSFDLVVEGAQAPRVDAKIAISQ